MNNMMKRQFIRFQKCILQREREGLERKGRSRDFFFFVFTLNWYRFYANCLRKTLRKLIRNLKFTRKTKKLIHSDGSEKIWVTLTSSGFAASVNGRTSASVRKFWSISFESGSSCCLSCTCWAVDTSNTDFRRLILKKKNAHNWIDTQYDKNR